MWAGPAACGLLLKMQHSLCFELFVHHKKFINCLRAYCCLMFARLFRLINELKPLSINYSEIFRFK